MSCDCGCRECESIEEECEHELVVLNNEWRNLIYELKMDYQDYGITSDRFKRKLEEFLRKS